jgi:hypothetical protein
MPAESFKERILSAVPIRDLGLTIEGTRLEPILQAFQAELEAAGIRRVKPRFYLTTEWGVPFGSVSLGIPFYLAHPDLTAVHAEQAGLVEGFNGADILRYLRHEMGHVVNYAYRLYETEQWVQHFGSITQPYVEDYRPQPFSRRFVRHLPGWYAQKHADEDWAETFAVWMTPGLDWRTEYASRPTPLAKLLYVDEVTTSLREKDPVVVAEDRDEDVTSLTESVPQFYGKQHTTDGEFPPGIEGALKAIFEDLGQPEEVPADVPRKPAAPLLRRMEADLLANVYRWTGHFPERTRALVRHLAERAEALGQVYPESREGQASLAVTTLVTALAMNYVQGGTYLP